jgi:charged multivesicular body protein 6
MLSGKMSNEDEDEVEDELEALEREARGVVGMPDAPSVTEGELPDAPKVTPKERIERRQERAAREASGPIAA